MFYVFTFIIIILLLYLFSYRKKKSQNEDFSTSEDEFQHSQTISNADNNTLSPAEIILLDYAPSFIVGKNDFQGFWRYRYNLENISNALESLAKRGFLKKETNISVNLSNLLLPNLKIILKENGLPVSGKKDDLIKRIVDGVSQDKLNDSEKVQRYFRTERADEALQKFEYIIYLHKHSNLENEIDLKILVDYIHKNSEKDFKECIADILQKKAENHFKRKEYSFARCTRLAQAEFYLSEKFYDKAYPFLLDVIYFDINNFIDNSISANTLLKDLIDFYKNSTQRNILDYTIEKLKQIQEKKSISCEQLKTDMKYRWFNIPTPYHILSVDDCCDIYFAELSNNQSKIDEVYMSSRSQNLSEEGDDVTLILGRLESGYRAFAKAKKSQSAEDYLGARAGYMSSIEAFKQAGASFEQNLADKALEDFARIDPIFNVLTKILTKIIEMNPGILQSEITGKLESAEWAELYSFQRPIKKEDIYYALYFADRFKMVIRNKKGRSYELFIPNSLPPSTLTEIQL